MEQTDRSRGWGWGNWNRLAKEHIWIYAYSMDTDNNVVKVVGVGRGTGVEWKEANGKKWGTSIIVPMIKKERKKKACQGKSYKYTSCDSFWKGNITKPQFCCLSTQ